MLKNPVQGFIEKLTGEWGVGKDTRLIVAALMTNTLSCNEQQITNRDTYLYRLYENYQILNDDEQLARMFAKNPNFVEK